MFARMVGLVGGCVVLIAMLTIYSLTVYVRLTNKTIGLLEEIAASTRK
jgi:hypothetical protein